MKYEPTNTQHRLELAHLGGALNVPLYPHGEKHPAAKLSDDDVRAILLRHPTEGTTRLAKIFAVSDTYIKRIIKNQGRR